MIVITTVLVLLFVVLFFSLIGVVLENFFDKDNCAKSNYYLVFFKSILIGNIFTIVIYSSIKSNFQSVFSILIPLFLYFIYLKRRKLHFHFSDTIGTLNYLYKENIKKLFLIVLLIIISFFTISIYSLKDFSNVKNVFYDYHVYSEIAKGLQNNGVESFQVRYYDFMNEYPGNLYHFFDLWLCSFVSDVFKLNTFKVLMLIVYPFYYFLTFLGITSILAKRINNIKLIITVSFVVVFSYSFDLSFFYNSEFFNNIKPLFPSNYNQLKLLVTYPILILAFHYFLIKKMSDAIIVLIILILSYGTLIVSIFPLLILVSVLDYIYYGSKKSFLYLTIFFIVFLVFLQNKDNIHNDQKIVFIKDIRLIVILLVENLFKIIVVYLPIFIFLLFYIFNKKVKINMVHMLLFTVVLISALFFVSIFHGNLDFDQALYNILPGFMLIFLLHLIFLNFHRTQVVFFSFLFVPFGVLNIYKNISNIPIGEKYSEDYILRCEKYLHKKNKVKALVCNQMGERWDYSFYDLAQFTSSFDNFSKGFNVYNDLNGSKTSSPFALWCKKNHFKSNIENLVTYMELNKIDYIFVKNGNKIKYNFNFDFEFLFKDSISNEMLFRLKSNKNG